MENVNLNNIMETRYGLNRYRSIENFELNQIKNYRVVFVIEVGDLKKFIHGCEINLVYNMNKDLIGYEYNESDWDQSLKLMKYFIEDEILDNEKYFKHKNKVEISFLFAGEYEIKEIPKIAQVFVREIEELVYDFYLKFEIEDFGELNLYVTWYKRTTLTGEIYDYQVMKSEEKKWRAELEKENNKNKSICNNG